jgi:hypothetical protein
MPARNSKGRFVKRSNSGGTRKRRKSTALVRTNTVVQTRYRTRSAPKARRRGRRSSGGGGIKPLHLAAAAAGVAYLTSASGPQTVKDLVAKVPGAKTFGAPAALGIGCLAVDKFVKPNKWLRLAGYAGIVAAAMKLGEQGKNFKWVGDADGGDDMYIADIEGDDDDVADVEQDYE